MRQKKLLILSIILVVAAACTADNADDSDETPTHTLAPLFTLTPRLTATPFSSPTPLPTFTPIPSETPIPPTASDTPTPTPTAPIVGIIQSLQSVNIREGPGTDYSAFRALNPGTGVEILGQNTDGTWLNILMDDGVEGWISRRLLFIEPTTTPFPTLTPSPDLTSLALGTPLPTALIGGGTVTPTPPRSAVTATPPGTPFEPEETDDPNIPPEPTNVFLPIIDVDAINSTATALAAGVIVPISPPAPAGEGQSPNARPTATERFISRATPSDEASDEGGVGTPESTVEVGATPITPPPANPDANVREGADVFALCDDLTFGVPAPTDIAAGSTIDVYWAWYVADPSFVDQHLENVSYEVRVNGELLSNWRQYGQRVVESGGSYAKFWYVPYGPLEPGTYTITYRATWDESISDGYEAFGPGTRNPFEEGSCTFSVG